MRRLTSSDRVRSGFNESILAEPFAAKLRTPFAVLGLRTSATALTGLEFLPLDSAEAGPADAIAEATVRQLERYLDDPAYRFDLPLQPRGTEFQRRVWKVLCSIPRGTALSYGEVAGRLRSSARAVGGACGANPIAVVIPCHRVVASDRRLGGFMGHREGDPLAIKRWLLAHEGLELS